ncbi:MAG: M23 family metallopeptidase [Nocardioidaceae bacterium]
MSSHRATKHRVNKPSATPRRSASGAHSSPSASLINHAEGGRRKASSSPRRTVGISLSTMIGGGALLAAAVGAATAGQAITTTPTPTASHHGSYVANLSSASLAGRDATQISRGGARPSVASGRASPQSQAEIQARARNQVLKSAANDAQNYAQQLSSDQWVLPTSGFHITVWFGESGGYWSSGYHTGIDFATDYGTPAVAVGNATVAQAGWDGSYGNQIRLQFENGDQVWYNHLSAIEVTEGQSILKGQEIGRVGDTGNAYGYHLHFEYRLAADLETAVDPAPFFAEHGLPLT